MWRSSGATNRLDLVRGMRSKFSERGIADKRKPNAMDRAAHLCPAGLARQLPVSADAAVATRERPQRPVGTEEARVPSRQAATAAPRAGSQMLT